MKRRGVASPDIADALACTFAAEMATVPASDWDTRGTVVTDWDPFSDEAMNDTAKTPRYYAEGWARLREDDSPNEWR
jgi:phage terminase Nu1 subunit (DNA packaging protein)